MTNPCISQGERSFCVPTACFLGEVKAGIFKTVRDKVLQMPGAKEYII